jgi:hypothetical protein
LAGLSSITVPLMTLQCSAGGPSGRAVHETLTLIIVNVPVKDVQADEIWSFIQKKEKQCGPDDNPNFGDAYCFVAI